MPPLKSCRSPIFATVLLMALIAPAFAQDETEAAPLRTVLKMLRYADVAAIEPLVEQVGVEVAVDPEHKQMVIRGPSSHLDTALKLVEALDVPEPRWGVDLYVHVFEASRESTSSTGIPAGLEPAFAEITERFSYRSFEIIDTVLLHATGDSGSARLTAALGDWGSLTVRCERIRVLYGEPQHVVRFENLAIACVEAGIDLETNVETRDGHPLVVGKSSRRGGDLDVVLVIEARLKDALPPDLEG